MRCVTLLLTGVPRYVTLPDLSYNLDRLFNTDEIATFKIRDLPNHPQTNKRQIALDFRNGYDAMAAQEKLEGYTYELESGREYTLHAKINKMEEYMRSRSWSPEYCGSSQWYRDEWMALTMIPNLPDREMYRAHARLDAQLELLKKQKLVLEKEKELLNEKQILKRQYGCMVASLYDVPSTDQRISYNEQSSDTDNNVLPSKRSRSRSRENWPASKQQRSRSRELRLLEYGHRSQSKDRGSALPQIEWHEANVTKRQLRSLERDRSRSSERRSRDKRSRDRRSCSLDSRDHRYPDTRYGRVSRERRSKSNDAAHKDRRPMSREWGYRARSRSRDRRSRTRDRKSTSRERRSRSREQRSWETQSRRRINRERRSRSKDRISYRRSRSRHRDSKSRERTPYNRQLSRSDYYRTGRRLRSPDRKIDQLYQSHRPLRERSPTDSVIEKTIDDITKDNADKRENKADINLDKRQQDKERKKIDKYNSKLRKTDKHEVRLQALSKDVMILTAILLDEIMDKYKIKISASNKADLIKKLDNIVQERLDPLANIKKNTDIEVMKSYKAKYPVEDDITTIKRMLGLGRIPKLEVIEPQATVIVPTADGMKNAADIVIWDLDSDHTKQESTNNLPQIENLAPVEIEVTQDTQIKEEPKEELVIIDLDSADKPIPRHPQFVLVIKSLVKNMNKVIRRDNLGDEIKMADLKHVLRHILRNMLKGEGFLSRDEIVLRFREVYPKEQDENFLMNTIKDIKDGKYPGLAGHVVDAPEIDAPDDVVVIEKHYDVVTIVDSDDEPDTSPSIPCQPASSNVATETSCVNDGQDKPDTADPGHTNTDPNNVGQVMAGPADPNKIMAGPADPNKIMAGPADPDKTMTDPVDNCKNVTGPADSSKTMTGPADPAKTMTGSANPAKTITGPADPGKTMTGPAHRGKTMTGPADPGRTVLAPGDAGNTMTGPAHRGKTMTGPADLGKPMTGPADPGRTVSAPGDAGNTMTGPAHRGKTMTVPADLGKPMTGPADPGRTVSAPGDAGNTMTGTAHRGKTMTGPGDLGQTVTGPAHSGKTITGPVNPGKTMTGPAYPGRTMAGPADVAKITTGPAHPGKTILGPADAAKTTTGPTRPGKTITGLIHPSKTMTGPADSGKTMTGPSNTGQGMRGSASDQAKTKVSGSQGAANPSIGLASSVNPAKTRPAKTCQANVNLQVPAKSLPKKEKNQKATLENTIENLESKEIQETPDKNSQASDSKEDKDINTNILENDSLKVTAITIVTSLNELIAKTANANNPEEEKPIEDIKEELEFEEETELDESSLTLADNVPRVTSITIMTSDAELFSLGQDNPKENHPKIEVDEIKNETDVYYDAEDNLLKGIEHAFNNAAFSSNIMETDLGNKNSVNNSEQLTSVNSIEQFRSKTPTGTQNNKTVQEEEETIESIVKYVASLY